MLLTALVLPGWVNALSSNWSQITFRTNLGVFKKIFLAESLRKVVRSVDLRIRQREAALSSYVGVTFGRETPFPALPDLSGGEQFSPHKFSSWIESKRPHQMSITPFRDYLKSTIPWPLNVALLGKKITCILQLDQIKLQSQAELRLRFEQKQSIFRSNNKPVSVGEMTHFVRHDDRPSELLCQGSAVVSGMCDHYGCEYSRVARVLPVNVPHIKFQWNKSTECAACSDEFPEIFDDLYSDVEVNATKRLMGFGFSKTGWFAIFYASLLVCRLPVQLQRNWKLSWWTG